MALETKELPRVFKYNSVELPDPGAQYTAEQVKELYSGTYPEIVNATIEGPEERDGALVYTFRRAVGTKGAGASVVQETMRRCPFCDCDEVEICRTNKNACWIRCGGCGADAQTHQTRAGAIANWNRRYSGRVGATIVDDGDADYKAAVQRSRAAQKRQGQHA